MQYPNRKLFCEQSMSKVLVFGLNFCETCQFIHLEFPYFSLFFVHSAKDA